MWKLYFSPSGRIGRSTYWLHCVLIRSVVQTMLIWMFDYIYYFAVPDWFILAVMVTLAVGVVALVWSFFAMTAKRLHDQDSSGWWSLLILIPVFGGLVLLCMAGFGGGDEGSNRYGDPV